MTRRRREIVLFSTSAIDLLACGLAAVLVLWVLTLGGGTRSETGEREAGFGEVRLKLFGVWHFNAIRLRGSDFSILNADSSTSSQLPADAILDGTDPHINLIKLQGASRWTRILESVTGNGGKIAIETRTWEKSASGKDAPFAGEVTVRFLGVRSSVSVDLAISICEATDETHYIEARRIDFRRPKIFRYVFQCETAANAMFKGKFKVPSKDDKTEWQTAFVDKLRSDVSLWTPNPVEYLVFDGAKCAPSQPQSLNIEYRTDGTVNLKLNPRAGASYEIDGKSTLELLADWAAAPPSVSGRP
jgi:hypothetical protein